MTMKIEYLPLSDIYNYEKNARTHSKQQVEQIVSSIREFGFTNPALIDEDNILIAGHGRALAAGELGLAEIPVIRLAHLSDSQKKALRIADNQLALNAGWDVDLLAEELHELETDGFDLNLMGFDGDFLDELLTGIDDTEDEDDSVPEVPERVVSVLGDLWILGNHRLMCGDSMDIKAGRTLTQNKSVDLLLTDPPYNVEYVGKTKKAMTIENDKMANDKFRQFLRGIYQAADKLMREGAVFYIWHADSEGANFRGAAADIGWKIRQCLVWNKNTMVLGRQDYHWKHEPCLYGWKEGAAHYWGSDRKQTTVLEFSRPTKSLDHPTMKPVALMEYQIKNSSKRGNRVLDLFGGSGSTLIACENTGRSARLMELDPRYTDVIVKRWQSHTGKQAIHEETGKNYDELMLSRGGGVLNANLDRVSCSCKAANDPCYTERRRA